MRRLTFSPFWRINKSDLPLGMTSDDLLYTMVVFLGSYVLFSEVIIPMLMSISFLVTTTSMQITHRKGAFIDLVIHKIKGERVYVVSKPRGFRSS